LAKIFGIKRDGVELDIGSAFDLICGTSTGAIVACALACGVPMSRVVELYARNGKKIFPRRLPKSAGLSLARDLLFRSSDLRAGTAALRAALEAELGDVNFAQVHAERGVALAIPSVALVNHRSWVFKTPHLASTSHRDDAVTLVDACLASSAAPVFRSIAMIGGTVTGADTRQPFVDGGLWANNPVLVGLIEALEMTGENQRIEIFCMGTVPTPTGQSVQENQVDRGLVGWAFGGKAAGLSIDAQQFAYDNMARMLAKHLRRECRIHRFPAAAAPASLLGYLDLDDGRDEAVKALQQQAGSDANLTNAACADPNDTAGQAICDLFLGDKMRIVGDLPRLGSAES
jgi:F0F1-type ATP synthase membrane subunit c/vacuolar-type H+-ATPase subunit K